MKPNARKHWIWVALFGLWLVLLTGFPHDLGRRMGIGFLKAPGAMQYFRLQQQVDKSEQELQAVKEASLAATQWNRALENDPRAQEREARRILGWVAPDELVFEF